MGKPVVIIGGGIIGCALARALARRGASVIVVERGTPGAQASSAAAGMLAPSSEAEKDGPLFPLARASLKLYASFAAELEAETGIDPHYRGEGTLLVFSSNEERDRIRERVDWQRSMNVPIEELSASQLHSWEPSLAPFAGAFHFSEDHQVDNRLLMHALVQSCRHYGVEFRLGKGALSVEKTGARVSALLMGDERLEAHTIVNAAGAWAGSIQVPGLAPAPIRPVKGHMLALQGADGLLRRVVRSEHAYLVPRAHGRVLVGSTMEEAGFDAVPRAGPLMELLQAARRLCPALEQSAVAEFWAGLRPASPDALPLLGPAGLDGYWMALGHFRNGILLAPISAQILSEWILTGQASIPDGILGGIPHARPAGAFDPSRFSNTRSEGFDAGATSRREHSRRD